MWRQSMRPAPRGVPKEARLAVRWWVVVAAIAAMQLLAALMGGD